MINHSATLAPTAKPQASPFVQLVNRWLQSDAFRLVSFIGLHVFLGLAFSQVPLTATLHAGAVFLWGAWFVIATPSLNRAAYLCAYITGAEVLWRMTQARIPWETGKFAITVYMLLAMGRAGKLRLSLLALLFFILLLPSAILPMAFETHEELRQALSFNLMGPLALAVSVCFFSQVCFTSKQLRTLFLCLVGPIVSIATVTLWGILSAKELVFDEKSNFVTSGGFGPNQVSSILGLGMLTLFLWSFDKAVSFHLRLFMYAVVLWLGIQSALTFSRGGLYSALLGATLASFFLIRDRRARLQLILGLIILLGATNYLIAPQLDSYTGGSISRRFSSTRLTGRDQLASEDLQVFWNNIVIGVGPGQTYKHRDRSSKAAAHTEFTRMLAEHGLLGAFAILVLGLLCLLHFKQARLPAGRALTIATISWSLTYMLVAAMRTVAPSFVFGLGASTIVADGPKTDGFKPNRIGNETSVIEPSTPSPPV